MKNLLTRLTTRTYSAEEQNYGEILTINFQRTRIRYRLIRKIPIASDARQNCSRIRFNRRECQCTRHCFAVRTELRKICIRLFSRRLRIKYSQRRVTSTGAFACIPLGFFAQQS